MQGVRDMFSRRKKPTEDASATESAPPAERAGDDEHLAGRDGDSAPTSGPYDSADPVPEVERLNLGGLQIPAIAEMQIRIEADPATQTVVSATVLINEGAVQLQAFAAPRAEPLWPDVRSDIADSMTQSGAACDEVDGPFGPELHGVVSVTSQDGKQQQIPAVFAGVDGPRWLLRLVFTGAAVSDDAVRASLEEVVRGVVIDRGTEPMAPRALIPLSMPSQLSDPGAAPAGGSSAGG